MTWPQRSQIEDDGLNLQVVDITVVYSNKFIMAVLRNGMPLKELANGVVKIPFGEFSLRFRNRHKNRRAMVKFFIDGEEAAGDGGYLIPANSCIEIERWANKPVKFNFVALDSPEAVDFGKNGPNEDKVKGTIEARFYLEKEKPSFTIIPTVHHHHHYPEPKQSPIWPIINPHPYFRHGTTCDNFFGRSYNHYTCDEQPINLNAGNKGSLMSLNSDSLISCNANSNQSVNWNCETPVLQDGCTVEGSHSSQKFSTVYFESETDYVSLKIFLQGYDEGMKTNPTPVQCSESEITRRIKELEKENQRLKALAEAKNLKQIQEELLQRLEYENEKLKQDWKIS